MHAYLTSVRSSPANRLQQLARGGHLAYFPQFLQPGEAGELFSRLQRETAWEHRGVPRRVFWVGDFEYRYAHVSHPASPWTPILARLRERVETLVFGRSEGQYRGVLLNLYRDGRDSVGFHADDEAEIRRHSPIASLSLGAAREFLLRYKGRDFARPSHLKLPLGHGSCVVMGGTLQDHWLHSIPKDATVLSPRINLTFRQYVVG